MGTARVAAGRTSSRLLAGVVLSASAALLAQQATPTFKAKTTHVLLDVVVTDKDDRPVTGLTADDFEISEDGRPQTVADFEHVSVPLGHRAIDLAAPLPPPPDVASNEAPPHTARAFVFVLDDGTLPPESIVPIKQVMTGFLSLLAPDDEVGLTVVSRSDLGQDFTRDTGSIIRAVNHLGAAMASGSKCDETLAVLDNLVRTLSAAREARHAIIYVAAGFPPAQRARASDCPEHLRVLFEQARQADVPVYTLDPRGLMAPDLGLATPAVRPGSTETMHEMALNTDARAFIGQSDVQRAVQAVIADNSDYYLIGYYPSPNVEDGKFHQTDLKVKRPDLHVRRREGYLADKAASGSSKPVRQVEALAAGLPGGDLALRAFATPIGPGEKGTRTSLSLDVLYPAADGAVRAANDELHVTWIAIDPDAKIKASGENTVAVPLAGQTPGPVTFAIDDVAELPKGHMTIRAAVSSRVLGAAGTVYLPIEIPAFGESRDALDVTPLVLGVEGGAAAPVVGVARLGSTSVSAFPFRPTTTRTFGENQTVRVFEQVFTASAPAALHAVLTLEHEGASVKSPTVRLAPVRARPGTIDGESFVPLEGLAPGAYVLELAVSGAGPDAVRRAVAFEVK